MSIANPIDELLSQFETVLKTNPILEKALNSLKKLKYCEAHATYIVTNGDKKTLKSLQINLTCEPKYINEI